MAELTDPRALRSRAALLAVAAEMLEHPGATAPSVTEIAERAGVSRPTFYKHFIDVPALITAAVTTELERAFAESDAALAGVRGLDFLRGTITAIIVVVHARRELYRSVLQGPTSYAVLSEIVDFVSARMRSKVLGARTAERPWLLAHEHVADDRIVAVAAGAMWIVARWLDTDFTGADAPDAFAERLTSIVLSLANLPDGFAN